MIVDLSSWSKENIYPLQNGELASRPGLRRIYAPDSGKRLVGGFSILNGHTFETWHYVFDVNTTGSKGLRLQILDEDFETFQIFAINSDVEPRVITYATIQDEIIIASPDFPTLWGMVGSSVRLAVKVASDNTATTAIDVPQGICTQWCNRVVIANSTSLYFSDPIAVTGGDPRTFVAENQNQRPSPIFGVHEAAGGMLVVSTAGGTYGLDAGAASVQIVGSNGADWRILNHVPITGYANTCVVKGRAYGMTQAGYALVDIESDAEEKISQPSMSRYFYAPIDDDDWRTGSRMMSGDDGPIVARDDINVCHVHNLPDQVTSWWRSAYDPTDFAVVGTLRNVDSSQLLVCGNGVFEVVGNFDGDIDISSAVETPPKAFFLGQIPGNPASSRTVRGLQLSAAVGGAGNIYASTQGDLQFATPPAYEPGLIIGTDSWGSATKRYTITPVQSRRMQFDVNVDDVAAEVGFDGALVRVLPVLDLDLSESAPMRPTDRG